MTAQIIPFKKEAEKDTVCSFCKTPKRKAKHMVQSETGKAICDKCILICKQLTNESN